MCGDEQAGGLATPEDFARFAVSLVARGYKGIKLHTWMPPIPGAPDELGRGGLIERSNIAPHSAGAAASDRQTMSVDLTPLRQVARGVDAVIGVDDAPHAIESLAIRPPETGAATVVDIDHAEAATGPELYFEIERSAGHRCWAAMADHDERREFATGTDEIGVRRGVIQRVRLRPALICRKRDRLRARQIR